MSAEGRRRSGLSIDGGFGDGPEPAPRSARGRRAERPGSIAEMPGRWILNVDIAATVILLAMTAIGAIAGGDAGVLVNITGAVVLFLGSCVLFTIGFLTAAARSRDDDVHLAGLYYLTDAAPDRVRRAFMGLWFAQIAIGLASIALVSPPFGVMATVFGVSANSAWSSRHGEFRSHPRR